MSQKSSTYKQEVLKNLEAISIKAIAEKIFTLMDNNRTSSADLDYQRRWIWELLQNAMDTTNSERDTIVEIVIDEKDLALSFKHNGNPFKVDNITCLVNQVSSKPRIANMDSKKRTIGKFGTGFITTHLLAEKVTLKSTVQSDTGGHKCFELVLDRSGKNEEELYKGVKDATEILLNLDTLPDVKEYDYHKMNTEFVYHLNEDGIKVAEVGINDLKKSLPFTMAFVKTISKVSLNGSLIFEYIGSKEISPGYHIHTINITGEEKKEILTLESEIEDAIIGIEVNIIGNDISLIETGEGIPKLFCNYPFIGTETFNSPVIFNSSSFNVYQERRNGIVLKDAETTQIKENKQILIECRNLYLRLLNLIASSKYNFKETYTVANFSMPAQYEWIGKQSRLWYKTEINDHLQKKILQEPIVEIHDSNEKAAVLKEDNKQRVWFPSNLKEEILEDIWILASNWLTYIPLKYQYKKWNKIPLPGIDKLTIEVFCNSLNNNSINWLQEQLDGTNNFFKTPVEWLNKFYSITDSDIKTVNKINTNKLAILPNQNGDFVVKSKLYTDGGGIPEELKDILNELGTDCRVTLLHTDVFLLGDIAIDKEKVFKFKNAADKIKEHVINFNSEKMRGVELSKQIKNAFQKLYVWLNKNPNRGEEFGELYNNKEKVLLDGETIKNLLDRDNKINDFLTKHGISNLNELENLIGNKKNDGIQTNDPENLLVSLGITTLMDLEKAKTQFENDKEISLALKHISSGDLGKLQKVLVMINRSKTNVKSALELNDEYDCTGWMETSITTISGIKKNGYPIKLVIRPGDGNQIILFYPDEFEVLEIPSNELWYDIETEQNSYSFGRFLKKANINRMPL